MVSTADILQAVGRAARDGKLIAVCLNPLAAGQTAAALGLDDHDPVEVHEVLVGALRDGCIQAISTGMERTMYGSDSRHELPVVSLRPAPLQV